MLASLSQANNSPAKAHCLPVHVTAMRQHFRLPKEQKLEPLDPSRPRWLLQLHNMAPWYMPDTRLFMSPDFNNAFTFLS